METKRDDLHDFEKEIYDSILAKMQSGGDATTLGVSKFVRLGGMTEKVQTPPFVVLSIGDDDDAPVRYFRNLDEVDEFVRELTASAVEAFGKQK